MGPASDSSGAGLFQQLLDMYVAPEIRRRIDTGQLGESFVLEAAQIICSPDGEPNRVRLNAEVQAIALVRKKEGVAKETGDPVYLDEIEGLETLELPETEDPNCGHATLLKLGEHWFIVFDFRYNRARSLALLAKARQFLSAAGHAYDEHAWSAFAYNLFTAMELAGKADLLSTPDPDFLKSKTHGAVHARLNLSARVGNIDLAHASAFNDLSDLRQRAAYEPDAFVLPPERAASLFAAVSAFLEKVAAKAGRPRVGS